MAIRSARRVRGRMRSGHGVAVLEVQARTKAIRPSRPIRPRPWSMVRPRASPGRLGGRPPALGRPFSAPFSPRLFHLCRPSLLVGPAPSPQRPSSSSSPSGRPPHVNVPISAARLTRPDCLPAPKAASSQVQTAFFWARPSGPGRFVLKYTKSPERLVARYRSDTGMRGLNRQNAGCWLVFW
jgi:hypothetical protein